MIFEETTMARIGVDLPREKRVQVGLTYVYGIGQTTANKIPGQPLVSTPIPASRT